MSWFNFKGPDQQRKVSELSGGERNRVHLAKLLRRGGNLLLLDEPTNDLDVDTLRALEDALLNFGGCAVVISHDRWFLDRIATHILAFEGDSKTVWCEGNYQTYEAQTEAAAGGGGGSAAPDQVQEADEVMGVLIDSCCIWNGGGGAWAFAPLAQQLASALWLEISETPRSYNYLLATDGFDPVACGELFISHRSIEIAADKRLSAQAFAADSVPTPETRFAYSLQDAERLCQENRAREWCLKYPIGCGASGHRLFAPGMALPKDWPYPLIMQEFIRLERPEVFRLYGAGGEVFGWVVRRFPSGVKPSPWVAHARGARYEFLGNVPREAAIVGQAALKAVGLFHSFGCVDLLRRSSGEWLALEVGTDGLHNHVDRDLGCPELERDILRRIAESFWERVGQRPWGTRDWFPRPMAGARETIVDALREAGGSDWDDIDDPEKFLEEMTGN